jgi:GNAT superfamily N-acetyltransferase
MSADPPPFGIRRAGLGDLGQLERLRKQAAERLAAKGLEQWSGAKWDAVWWEKTTLSVLAGRTWVVVAAPDEEHPELVGPGALVAGAIAFGAPDLDFWEPDEDRWFARDAGGTQITPGGPAAAAAYFYRFAVGSQFAGLQLGEALLDWAGKWAAQEGRTWLRCDCNRANTGLHAYYQRCGFEYVRTVEAGHRASGALFQRPASKRGYTGPIRFLYLPDPDPLPDEERSWNLHWVQRRAESLRSMAQA